MLDGLIVYKVLKIDKNEFINRFLRVRNVMNEISSHLRLFSKFSPFWLFYQKNVADFLDMDDNCYYTTIFNHII